MASPDRGFDEIRPERGKAPDNVNRGLHVKPSTGVQSVNLDPIPPMLAQLAQETFVHREVRAEVIANRRVALIQQSLDALQIRSDVRLRLTRSQWVRKRNPVADLATEELVEGHVQCLTDGIVQRDVNTTHNLMCPLLVTEGDLDGRQVKRTVPDEQRLQSSFQRTDGLRRKLPTQIRHLSQTRDVGIRVQQHDEVVRNRLLRIRRTGASHFTC